MAQAVAAASRYDALVIGAGPAGCALARQLARGGWRVLLVDREPSGRDRVCGGFLGVEARGLWTPLGLTTQIAALPMGRVSRFVMSGPKTRFIDTPLPGGEGLGVDRAVFDRWLCDHAAAAGAEVRRPATVGEPARHGDGWHALVTSQGRSESIEARVVVRAHGRRRAAASSSANPRAFFGCKAAYDGVAGLDDEVALHFVRRGHVGFNRSAGGRTTMCLYVERARLVDARGDLDRMLTRVADENPRIADCLRGARRVGEWMGCPAEPDGRELFYDRGIFHVGDAVTMVNTIIGGGLAIAMGSAIILARMLMQGRARQLSPWVVAGHYSRAWRGQFGGQLGFGRWLGWCERSDRAAEWLLRLVSAQPALLRPLVRYSRPVLRAPGATAVL